MNKTKLTSLAASLVLAMAFTFSCSSDGDDDGGGTQGSVSSSSDGGGLSSGVPGVSSSSDGGGLSSGSGGGEATITKSKITGVSQKGPFVEGSTVTLYELNDKLDQTGRSFKSIISDNKGSFEIRGVELISPYAMLEANGYYRNEVTGEVSKSLISLFAIADVREKDNFNVNLLTHLEYYRVLNLVEGGKSVAEAKKQAQKEILAVFGIDGNFENSEDMSIFGKTDGDAALLAISILLQSNLGEGEFSQRLTNFAQSLKESGKWENEAAKTAIADWVAAGFSAGGVIVGPSSSSVRRSSSSAAIRALSPDDGEISFISSIRNNILAWGLSLEVPDFGKYITAYWTTAYGLGGCGSANDGEVKKDNRNVYRICKTSNWAVASELEYDTYKLSCSAANEGEIKKGSVSETEYICKSKAWGVATQFERDTYKWSCSAANEWETKKGNASDNIYTCKNNVWQEPNYKDKYCFENKNKCTYFTDTRDKQRYSYVVIGEQTWMAENLNYNASGSKCYNNSNSDCEIYGRFYDWETAKKSCPSGWHLPTYEEWEVMTTYIGDDGTGGKKLKATSGWGYNGNGNGTDEFGFSALPGGGYSDGSFNNVGIYGFWWSASEDDATNYAYHQLMIYSNDNVAMKSNSKSSLYSVRCLQD